MSRVRELFLKLIGSAGTYLAVKPEVTAALGASSPACLFVLGGIAVGLGIFSTYQAFSDWASDKKLDEIVEEMHRLILPTLAGLRGAAEELAVDDPSLLPGLPEDDRRRPFAIVFNMIRKGINDAVAFQNQVSGLFEKHVGWEQEIAAFLQSEFETLQRELDFTRDDLVDIADGLQKLSSDIQRLLEQTGHAPPLLLPIEVYLPQRHQESIIRFVYKMRRVPMFGRRAQSLDLWQFLQSRETRPDKLLWWLWTGAAGNGKSRLAYEFALTARAGGWWAGLLDEGSGYDRWHNWHPDRPTLIVVDYVARRAEQTGQIIAGLYDRRSELMHPVRFLLLERRFSEEDPWYRRFEHRESGSKRASIENARYDAPRMLPELDDTSLYEVIRRVFAEYNMDPRMARSSSVTRLLEVT